MDMFGIDENTSGTTVMSIFADQAKTSTTDIDPPVSELVEPVKISLQPH